MTVFLRLYLSTFTTDFDGETVFLRLYLWTFTKDIDYDCFLTLILINIYYFDGGTVFLRWSLADEGDSAAAYTYQHLQQTLTEGLYSYAGLSQMKEIRLLPILINIYNRLWRRDCILTLVSRRWRRFGCCLYLSTFTTDFDGGTVFLRWSLADEGDSAAAYTYQHLQQTLTEGLYSYAGLSQMKEIRLLHGTSSQASLILSSSTRQCSLPWWLFGCPWYHPVKVRGLWVLAHTHSPSTTISLPPSQKFPAKY